MPSCQLPAAANRKQNRQILGRTPLTVVAINRCLTHKTGHLMSNTFLLFSHI